MFLINAVFACRRRGRGQLIGDTRDGRGFSHGAGEAPPHPLHPGHPPASDFQLRWGSYCISHGSPRPLSSARETTGTRHSRPSPCLCSAPGDRARPSSTSRGGVIGVAIPGGDITEVVSHPGALPPSSRLSQEIAHGGVGWGLESSQRSARPLTSPAAENEKPPAAPWTHLRFPKRGCQSTRGHAPSTQTTWKRTAMRLATPTDLATPLRFLKPSVKDPRPRPVRPGPAPSAQATPQHAGAGTVCEALTPRSLKVVCEREGGAMPPELLSSVRRAPQCLLCDDVRLYTITYNYIQLYTII